MSAANGDFFSLDYIRDRIQHTLTEADLARINLALEELNGAIGDEVSPQWRTPPSSSGTSLPASRPRGDAAGFGAELLAARSRAEQSSSALWP